MGKDKTIFLAALTILLFLGFSSTIYAEAVTFTSACECETTQGELCHGVYRWGVKIDDDTNYDEVTDVKPSDIGKWSGPSGVKIGKNTERVDWENEWFRLTGKVALIRAESDGDLHIQLINENGNKKSVNVVVEVPAGEPWCEIRKEVFSWLDIKFPFKVSSSKNLKLTEVPIISVTGKAFYDGQHGKPNTTPNRRKNSNVTIWEIHPVMELEKK